MSDRSRRALIVEDEPLVCMMVTDSLEELGFQAIEATTAEQALKLADAEKGTLAFALVDLGLPDMPGEQLLARLQEHHPSLPIIVASGKGGHELASSPEDPRKIVVLPKPYSFEQLRTALTKLTLG